MSTMMLADFETGDVVFRHGDVLLKKDERKASGRFLKSALLHKGENHHHRLVGGEFRIQEKDGVKLLEVKNTAKLTHEEHGPISVMPGRYMVDIQHEYDHWLEESRQVID